MGWPLPILEVGFSDSPDIDIRSLLSSNPCFLADGNTCCRRSEYNRHLNNGILWEEPLGVCVGVKVGLEVGIMSKDDARIFNCSCGVRRQQCGT